MLKFKKIFQIFILGKFLSKYPEKKANILNYIFYHFEFVVYFAPLLHKVERDIILDLRSTAASIKWMLESGDTSTRRVWLCEDPHSSVVGAVYVNVLRTLICDWIKYLLEVSYNRDPRTWELAAPNTLPCGSTHNQARHVGVSPLPRFDFTLSNNSIRKLCKEYYILRNDKIWY